MSDYSLDLPTYEELLQRGLSALPEGTDASENSFYYPIASAFAFMGNELAISMQTVYNAMFIENRSGSELDAFIGDNTTLTRRQATRASGEVTFTGSDGAYVPQGTRVAAGDQEFVTLWGDTIKGTTVTIDVQAVNIGNIGYIAASAIDTIVSQLENVTGVTNTRALTNGTDEETDASFRERYKWQLQNFPYNLNASTIKVWAYEVDGIGQVRVVGSKKEETITVYALDSNWEPASEDLITELQAHIANKLEYGFTVFVTAPTKELVDINVTVKEEDETLSATIKTALEKAIKTYPDPSYERKSLTIWEVINAVESVANMDNIEDIKIEDGSSATYTLSATDGSKLLAIGDVTVIVAT